MKRGKKAQLTPFLILAIIVIVAGVAIYYIQQVAEEERYERELALRLQSEIGSDIIINQINTCQEGIADTVLFMIGVQGGYYDFSERYMDLGWTFVPYYYDKGDSFIPGLSFIEKNIETYFDDIFLNCINNVNTGEFELSHSEPKTDVSIKPNEVSFVVDMDFTISKESESTAYKLKEFPLVLKHKLYEIYEVADYISKSHEDEELCLNCLAEMAEQRELIVDFLAIDDNVNLVVITEEIEDQPVYSFEFIEIYEGGENVTTPEIPEPV